MKRYFFFFIIVLCTVPNAVAQNKGQSVATIATYEGVDRMARLIEGAKKEGMLNLYTSIAASDVSLMTAEFEKRYGIRVNVWRAANDKVLQRVLAEQAARRNDVDAVQIASLELEALARENALQEVRSPNFTYLIGGAVPNHHKWAAHYLNVWVQAYNTQKVRKDELPKTYSDLLDPRWRGRLGIEIKNEEWFYTVVEGMGESAGLQFFRPGCHEWNFGAYWALAPEQHGGLGRSPAGTDCLQLYAGAGEGQRRANRLVCHRARHRACQWYRRRPAGPASIRGDTVL